MSRPGRADFGMENDTPLRRDSSFCEICLSARVLRRIDEMAGIEYCPTCVNGVLRTSW